MSDVPSDLSAFHAMTDTAVASLPEPYRQTARELSIFVRDLPPSAMLEELGISDPMDLTGLYEGIPLPEKSFSEQPLAPDVIWLFRKPILAEWRARGDISLQDLVIHVLVHELAHHFGWTDAQIAEIDRWWE